MGKVNRELRIDFGDGRKCNVAITNRLLRRIDAGLAPSSYMTALAKMGKSIEAARIDKTSIAAADFPLFDLVYIVSEIVSEGGIDVDEDDLHDDVSADLAGGGEWVIPIVEKLFEIITPMSAKAETGNAPAPAKRTGAKRKK